MKYTWNITLSTDGSRLIHGGAPPGESESPTFSEKLVTASGSSEVPWHIALKLLGFLLFIEHRPLVEYSIGWHYKPDLVVPGNGGPHGAEKGRMPATGSPLGGSATPLLWIDCGNIALRKIDRLSRRLPSGVFHILRRNAGEGIRLAAAVAEKVRRPENVTVHYFDSGVVDALADRLDASNTILGHRSEGHLAFTLENRHGTKQIETAVRSVTCHSQIS